MSADLARVQGRSRGRSEWHVLPVVAHEQSVIEFRRDGYEPLRQIIEVGDVSVLVNVALTPAV